MCVWPGIWKQIGPVASLLSLAPPVTTRALLARSLYNLRVRISESLLYLLLALAAAWATGAQPFKTGRGAVEVAPGVR